MAVYINGISAISPQETFKNEHFLEEIIAYEQQYLLVKAPNYKELLPARARRRMSRIVKMGVTAARTSLLDADVEIPDAIITGTGMGCLEDTEKFLLAILNDKEQFLTPISFIQSTHNTVGGTIALMLKCHNYNFTYVHRGFSFESALLDGMLQLEEGEVENALIGGVDEMTERFHTIQIQLPFWKQTPVNNLELLQYETAGSLLGEGATFFLLGKEKTSNTYAKIAGIHLLYNPASEHEITNELTAFLSRNETSLAEIDVVVLGLSGDKKYDANYHSLQSGIFKNMVQTMYKHLSGEYHTDSSFALWVAAQIIRKQEVPTGIKINTVEKESFKKVLIYTHYRNKNHSFQLVVAP